jgi:F-type H+-transporting ATPase subunit delta
MHESLKGYEIAVLQNASSGGGAGAVASDLRAVSDLIGRTPVLAQVLTDEVVSRSARVGVTDDLLSSRVGADALRIVKRAVSADHADTLLSALIDIADVATQFDNLGYGQFEAEEQILGRTAARRQAAGYADAIFEDIAVASELEQIEDELFRFANVIRSNEALRAALADSNRPVGDRRKLVGDLLTGRVSPVTIRLARAALHGRSRDPVSSLEWMAELAAQARGWRVARVTAARPLDDEERSELGRALGEMTGRPVELLVTENDDLIGGAIISIGNVLVDASVQHRLDQLSEQLLGSEAAAH